MADVTPPVSILVPMRNEEEFIAACLASLRAQAYAGHLEILVLNGESTDRSAEIVHGIAVEDPRVKLLANPGRIQARAMNVGLRAAQGAILLRADAHAVYGPDYVATCVGHLVRGEAENVGGLQRGEGATYFTRALTVALASTLGAGGAAYRTASAPCYTDTVWLGAWRRETLETLGGFNETLAQNEDYELNVRLRQAGGRVLLDPALPGRYFPRTSPLTLARQYFRYGRAKVRVLRLHPGSLVLRQLLPPAAVAALLLSLALLPFTPLPAALCWGAYLLALLLGSLSAARRAPVALPVLPLIFVIIHLAWGLGVWREMLWPGASRSA